MITSWTVSGTRNSRTKGKHSESLPLIVEKAGSGWAVWYSQQNTWALVASNKRLWTHKNHMQDVFMKKSSWILVVVPLFLFFPAVNVAIGFDDADLRRLQSTNQCPGCNLTGIRLSEAKLPNAILSGANISSASISNSKLTNADLSGANLAYINLTRADLSGANMSSADLRVAILTDAKLQKANLSKANLSGAALFDANLTGANLDGANLTGAFLDGAIWVDGKKCQKGSKGECRK
jgi:uncharacterized protein YjbI with pentapeptide repeats